MFHLVRKCDLAKDFATENELRGTARRLAGCPLGQRALREQACGYNHNKFNMLLEPRLDNIVYPITQKATDWMHCFFVHGVWNTVLYLVIMALVASGVAAAAAQDLHDFVLLWTLPGRLGGERAGRSLAEPFSKARWTAAKKAKYIKCQASTALSLCAIVCYWLLTVFHRAGVCCIEIDCYVHVCDIIDLIQSIPHGLVTANDIDAAVDKLLSKALEAHWHRFIGPKWHWMVHFGDQLRRFAHKIRALLSCWMHERKHKVIKRFGELHRSTCSMEEGILADVTLQHLYDMESVDKFDKSPRLLKPMTACSTLVAHRLRAIAGIPDGMSIYAARRARCSEFEICHVRDVVLYWGHAGGLVFGQVWFFFQYGMHPAMALIACWPTVSREPSYGSATVQMDEIDIITTPVSDIVRALTYKRRKDGKANVLVPSIYRAQI